MGEKRPANTFKQKLLLKAYNPPMTTSFNVGFHCSAPLFRIGDNVGLGDTKIVAYAPIEIGDNCSLQSN